jgi:hypothetical protein
VTIRKRGIPSAFSKERIIALFLVFIDRHFWRDFFVGGDFCRQVLRERNSVLRASRAGKFRQCSLAHGEWPSSVKASIDCIARSIMLARTPEPINRARLVGLSRLQRHWAWPRSPTVTSRLQHAVDRLGLGSPDHHHPIIDKTRSRQSSELRT